MQSRYQALELKVPPVVVALITIILIALTAWCLPIWRINIAFKWYWVGLTLALAAQLGIGGLWAFYQVKTTAMPTQPEQATALVTNGVYRYTRNPMYLGLVLIFTALIIFLQQPLAFVWVGVFIAYITLFQIKPEERALSAKFGQRYQDYQRQVRRWI